MYKRIFPVHRRWFWWSWWANLVYAVAWAIGTVGLMNHLIGVDIENLTFHMLIYLQTPYLIFMCDPPQYFWEQMRVKTSDQQISGAMKGKCAPGVDWKAGLPFVFSLISDIGILIMPIAALSGLKLPIRKKLGLFLIFSFGAL